MGDELEAHHASSVMNCIHESSFSSSSTQEDEGGGMRTSGDKVS